MKKIKVLQAIASLRLGGAERVALNYYKYIDRNRFEFDYLVYGDEIGELEEEVYRLKGRVIRIPPPTDGLFKFIKNLRKVLKENGPYDVVHSHPLFNSGLILRAAHLEGVAKKIAHAHSARFNEKKSIPRRIYNYIMRYCIHKYSTHALACSKDAGNYLFGNMFFREKGRIIKNGIEVNEYIFDFNKRIKIRRELQLNDEFIIGHVGRLSKVKNQEFILDIFKKIKEIHKNSKLILVGGGTLEKQLKDKTKMLNLQNDVMFLGPRNDIDQLLQGMDIFLFPSIYEGLGIAVIEAQATGLRCIISDNITTEVDITNLIDRIPLNQDELAWANQVLKYSNIQRSDYSIEDIVQSGYDIRIVMQDINEIYRL